MMKLGNSNPVFGKGKGMGKGWGQKLQKKEHTVSSLMSALGACRCSMASCESGLFSPRDSRAAAAFTCTLML